MDELKNSHIASLNDQLVNFDFDRNYICYGFADDDSWVGNTSKRDEVLNHDGIDDKSSLSTSCYDHKDLSEYNSHVIDFTLHTIVEESCEESELEYYSDNSLDGSNAGSNPENNISSATIEGCFDFGFEDQHINYFYLDDSSSEILSDLSGSVQAAATNNKGDDRSLPASRLEKYFLSEFMGFVTLNKSDSSVCSDSEGQPSHGRRKKKLRVRRTPRSNHSSFDNFLVEPAKSDEQFNESFGFSESDTETFKNEVVKFDMPDKNCSKRKKTHKKRELIESTNSISSVQCRNINWQNIKQAIPYKQEGFETKKEQFSTKTCLGQTDCCNNWSSDEEINVMMSKMKTFFKTPIDGNPGINSSNSYCIPTEHQTFQYKTGDIQFPHFESELIYLMQKIPSISNQQLREIMEYLNSEVTWSDSNDSSDLNVSSFIISFKNWKLCQNSTEHIRIKSDYFLRAETSFIHTNLFESLIADTKYENHLCNSEQTEQLLVNIWQHIGQKLVYLMREDNIGPQCEASPNIEAPAKESLPDKTDCSLALVYQLQDGIPRSKSKDIIVGTTNRPWYSYSSKAVNENTSESSDADRFSWRGSFESALFAPGDSRDKLLVFGRENSSHISHWSLLKRASADNLWCTSVHNRNPLDRVQSCGSILGNDDKNSLDIQKMWLSSFADKKNVSDVGTSFKRTINKCTSSLPALQLLQYAANISDNSKLEPSVIGEVVKSARYRSPVIPSNISCFISPTKRYKNKIQQETYNVSCLHKNINFKSSLDDISFSELNSNVIHSQAFEEKSYKRNTTYLRGRSEVLASVCSYRQNDHVNVKGHVEFGMQYNYKVSALEIHVVQCKDLASVHSKKCKNDPYVKVYLLPDMSKCGKRKTKVKRQTLNPVFNETLHFHLPINELKKHSIWLTVWNSDLLGRNDFLGEVIIDLGDKVFDNTQSQWYTLHQKRILVGDNSIHQGVLVVALKFTTTKNSSANKEPSSENENTISCSKGNLHILLKEGKYLRSNRTTATFDTFCKSYLLPTRTKSSKKKTHVIKKSLNPRWYYSFVYEDLTIDELSNRALELTVWDHDHLRKNQLIGGVRFSLGTGMHSGNQVSWMESTDKEIYLWHEMMNRPNFWVEGGVEIRSNLNSEREEIDET